MLTDSLADPSMEGVATLEGSLRGERLICRAARGTVGAAALGAGKFGLDAWQGSEVGQLGVLVLGAALLLLVPFWIYAEMKRIGVSRALSRAREVAAGCAEPEAQEVLGVPARETATTEQPDEVRCTTLPASADLPELPPGEADASARVL